ncbi:MAG: hypothetical protein WCK09_17295 [Bacteroidota bacterium]
MVTLKPYPAAIAGADRNLCLGSSTTLGAAAVPGSTYFWTSVPSTMISTIANPTVTPLVTTTYTVVETNTATQCTNSHSVTVTVYPGLPIQPTHSIPTPQSRRLPVYSPFQRFPVPQAVRLPPMW